MRRGLLRARLASVLLAGSCLLTPLAGFAETMLWSQNFSADASGLSALPSSASVNNGVLNLATDNNATIYSQHIYAFDAGVRLRAELAMLNDSASGNDEIRVGAGNLSGSRRHELAFHNGQMYAVRKGVAGEQYTALGVYQFNTPYVIEIAADATSGTTLTVYELAAGPGSAVSNPMNETDWDEFNGFIRLLRADSGQAATAELDNLVEDIDTDLAVGDIVLWEQTFANNTNGLDGINSYFTVQNGRLDISVPSNANYTQVHGARRYAPLTGVSFRGELTPQSWGANTYISLGLRDPDTGHGHLASVKNGQWLALAITHGNYQETVLGAADLNTSYRIELDSGATGSDLYIYASGSDRESGLQHSYSQTGWTGLQTYLELYAAGGGATAEAALDTLREIIPSGLIQPPQLSIAAPQPGDFVNSATPVFALSYSSQTTINTASIQFTENGTPLTIDCDANQLGANCTPTSPFSEGLHTVSATVADILDNVSIPAEVTFTVDTIPPVVTLSSPQTGLITNQPNQTLAGSLSEAVQSLTLNLNNNLQSLQTQIDNTFTAQIALSEGGNQITVTASDFAGNLGNASRSPVLDTQSPAIPDIVLIGVGEPVEGIVTITGDAGSAEAGSTVTITNTRTGETVTVAADVNGAFIIQIAAEAGDLLQIQLSDAAGNLSDTASVTVQANLPPDPATIAPPLNPTQITPLLDATAFLYTGSNPIQTGVAPNTIEARRVAVIRGTVRDKQNNPLPGVTVTVHNQPEFGQTISRLDGMFDLVVNGGGILTLNYEKENYLPAQRQVHAPWQDYVFADDVILIPLDAQVTAITINSQTMQVAQGTSQTDEDGTRQATILFPAGTTATMTLPDGTQQALTTLNVRATEYTVGDNGPETMPAALPPASGYTYAVELSVDEAITVNATRVDFNQPLPFYVDNFLNFPTGEAVPVGWYDRERAVWVPSDNGRVIEILSIDNGVAILDVTGSGNPATQTQLDELNITLAEQQQLAQLYSAGATLWRSPITHFTPWDCNWPYGPPEDAEPPPAEKPETPDADDPDTKDRERCEGCVIEPQGQVLREEIPIAGTPYSLHYGSDRVPGRRTGNTLRIPVSGASLPESLISMDVSIEIAGRRITQNFEPQTNLEYVFEWDGFDGFGREVHGSRTATIRVDYNYPCFYLRSASGSGGGSSGNRSFGIPSGSFEVIGTRDNCGRFMFPRNWQVTLQSPFQNPVSVISDWSLNVHHAWEAGQSLLIQGDGGARNAGVSIIQTVAGNGTIGFPNDGSQVTEAALGVPHGMVLDKAGNLYVSIVTAPHSVRRIDPNGIITTIAGGNTQGSFGDGIPAIQARVGNPAGLAFDTEDNLYIAELDNRIRRVDTNGIITTVAGTGTSGFSGDGGPATAAQLWQPSDITVDAAGNLYIADTLNHRIRRVDVNGIITTIAGIGVQGFSGDGGPAIQAQLRGPTGIVVDQAGNLFILDWSNHCIRRIDAEGIITTVAGTCGFFGFTGDGGPATAARLELFRGIDIDREGNIYVSHTNFNNNRIRRIGVDGIITTIAGRSPSGFSGDGGPATDAQILNTWGVAADVAGNLYIADTGNRRIRRISNAGLLFQSTIASEDGTQQFIFDNGGRHLHTLNTFTGETEVEFGRDSEGRLISITDIDGDITVIERNTNGDATAIIASDGQRTELTIDASGHLVAVTNPANESYQMTYTSGGLLTGFRDRRNQLNTFEYDNLGRLTQDINAGGGGWTLARTELGKGYQTAMTTAEGRELSFTVEPQTNGERIQINTAADGSVQQKLFRTNGQQVTTQPDGTVITVQEGPDPRFGMQSPVPTSVTVQTPGGLTSTTTTTRVAALSNMADPLSLQSWGETTTINNRAFQTNYNAATRTYTRTSAQGRTATQTINEQGRPTHFQIAGLAPVNFGYDNRGRMETILAGSGAEQRSTAMSYYQSGPQQGYLQSITDAANRTVSFEYDAVGRVTRQILPDAREILYGYNENGNVTSITPPGRPAHVFNYNAFDLEGEYVPPAITGITTPQTVYDYNLDKELVRITRPDGQEINFNYNATTGQLESLTTEDTENTETGRYSYTYLASGQLDTITSPDNIVLDYSYNGFLVTGVEWTGAVNGQFSVTYNNNFFVTSDCVNVTTCVSYQYDNDGLLTSAGSLVINRDTQRGGLPTGTVLGDLQTTKTYNTFGELEAVSASYDMTSLYSVLYQRDNFGRITQKAETVAGNSVTESYDYDTAGRLTTVVRNGITTSYVYDSNGNRLSKTTGSNTETGIYDAQDRLTSYNGCTYSYSDSGELQTKVCGTETTQYVYDAIGNLVAVTLPDATVIEYLIDGQNRRVGKQINGTLTQGFLYQDQLNPIAELNPDGSIRSRFVYGDKINIPSYMIRDGVTYRIISDHLGSPRLILNTADGSVVQRIDYDEFGNVTLDTNVGFQPFSFAGGLYDADTGLVRFGARDFDPETGRWAAKDPIGFQGDSLNFYGYSINDPVNLQDVNGLFWHVAAGAAVGGVMGGVNAAINGQSIAIGFGTGAAAGAATALFPAAALSSLSTSFGAGAAATALHMLGGAAVAGGAEYLNQKLNGDCINPISIGAAAFGGFMGGAAGSLLLSGGLGKTAAAAMSSGVGGGPSIGASLGTNMAYGR